MSSGVPPAIRIVDEMPGTGDDDHLHTWRIWRRVGGRRRTVPQWHGVMKVKALDPWDALDRCRAPRGTYLVIHADAERVQAIAAGGDFEYESVSIIKRRLL
jgi:hypothetical protein